MKHVRVPMAIKLLDPTGKPICNERGEQLEHTFFEFLRLRLADPKFCDSSSSIYLSFKIREKLDQAEAGRLDYLSLEDEEHRRVWEVTDRPSQGAGYNPALVHNIVVFLRAVERPVEKVPGEIMEEGSAILS